jgi:hypothetical protein
MSYTFTRTIPQMVEIVLRKLGALGIGETVSPEDKAVVREAIDLRLKELHGLGVLWYNVAGATTDLVLTGGVATKSLSAITDFLFPVTVKLRVGTEDREVDIISHREYHDIDNKADAGEPEKVFFAPGGTAYFWPVPQTGYTAKMTYQAIAEDTTSTGVPDIPASMMRALSAVVAWDLLEEFEVVGAKAASLTQQGKDAEKTIRTLNTERVDITPVEMTSF